MIKSIHPFAARMAPEILDAILESCPKNGVVLDPMCGSGTVVRKAIASGRKAIGLDTDPLAIIMSSVATRRLNAQLVETELARILAYARRYRRYLKETQACEETQRFIRYWFALKQRRDLNAIARGIELAVRRETPAEILNLFRLALSRTIVTKSVGASLAADVSHSRPHKVRDKNNYDVLSGFESSVRKILLVVNSTQILESAKIRLDDARLLRSVKSSSVDLVITSPPYLNALDYLRGHKLSLVWLGKTIPELRQLRSSNVGAESAPKLNSKVELSWEEIASSFPGLGELSPRQQRMTHRYALDLFQMCKQFSRVLKCGCELHTVIGNSTLGRVYVPNSELFAFCCKKFGFKLKNEFERNIPQNRRYLPISGEIGELSKRMKSEVIQTYVLRKT
jgi:DNA modification methylase